jgi:hypothetical protein
MIEEMRGSKLHTNRPRLTGDEITEIKNQRIKTESERVGLDINTVHSGWVKTKESSLYFQNPMFGKVSYEDVRDKFIQDARSHAPNYPEIKRDKSNGNYLLCINISDLHIGKLSSETATGEKYDVQIAIDRAKRAVGGLLQASSGYNIQAIVLPTGNDILHQDGSKAATTKGTPQDVSGTWHDNFIAARKMYVDIIEMLITVADVHVIHVPSNHDYANGFFLSDALSCWFSKSNNVTFDVDMKHRKYYQFGNNLIGYSHGDGVKMEHLPLLMANEARKTWAETEYRYIYLGHIHHRNAYKFQSAKDYHGVTVEYMRSPSATDSWHHIHGYQHVKRAIEAFVHHEYNGQVAKLTHHV